MEKRTKKMLLAILMIISILATDFFVLGSGIITYASQFNSETNNVNIEFSAYFKEGENRVDSIEKSIKAEDVKLYAEIKVKNEGYLREGTTIEIENSNFNLKNEIPESNTHINSIEGNKVNLKQINNGETVELELGIKPIIEDVIKTDFLSQTSTVKIIGTYVYSKAENGQSITADKTICINYQPDETTVAELETDIITNKILAVNGENKRIVQLLVKSRITNNEYPVKKTVIKTQIPVLSEETPEVSAIAINELATSGKTEIDNMTTENGIVKITLNNETSWMKNAYDQIVITYIYPETVDASKVEITTNSDVTLYDTKETVLNATSEEKSENEELNSTIIGRTEVTTKELYKGKLYANLDLTYKTETELAITNPNVVEEIVLHEGADVFATSEKEITANTKYVSTEINLEKMLGILGQDGNIEIKYGETSHVINKDTATNENGNAVINYENATAELDITTSNPVNAGILELKHTKTIIGKDYTRAQLQGVQNLKTKGTVEGIITVNEETQKVISNSTETGILELKETISKAELTMENNKTALSTTKANEVTLGITLITNGEQYDLYKNPKISLKFPVAVKNVELISTPTKQNADEFTVNVGTFDSTNKTLLINLQGEQTKYPESELTQAYIQLNLNVTLEELALGQTDKIMMAYINENAVQYEGGRTDSGRVEKEVEISAPSQLIKMFNLSSNENTSFTETILQRVKQSEAGKTYDLGITLINNKDSNISNMKILGKLPTTKNVVNDEKENTLETILKGIKAENATIYYTENANATEDVNDATNGWTTSLLPNAKLYLIKVDSLERGAKFVATVTVQLSNTIEENVVSYTQYELIYDTATETNVKENSRKIELATSVAASIETEIKAQVGQDVLQNGDAIKEGEVIKYTVTVNNKGTDTLENVQLKLDVPEGTTYVRPVNEVLTEEVEDFNFKIQEGYTYVDGYYAELIDSKTQDEITSINIPQLTKTEPYVIEYEVRVNKGTANTEISNMPIIIYEELDAGRTEIKNTVEEANIRVSIENADNDLGELYSGGAAYYVIYIENLSNEIINNLEVQAILEGLDIENNLDKITINELGAKETKSLIINGTINTDVDEMKASAIVKDSNGRIYRSNYVNDSYQKLDMTISMDSPQKGKYIKEGDTIDYNITIKNIGEANAETLVEMTIPNELQVQAIYLDGVIKKQCLDENDTETYTKKILNNMQESVIVETNKTIRLKITAKVLNILDYNHGKIITNSATMSANGIYQNTSEMVTHVLKAKDENLDNVIGGVAWFDENKNGQMDGNERKLSDIIVKLYDNSTQDYLKDDKGSVIKTQTDYKGEYSFTNIKDGSYLVVFEYDTEKYVLTTQCAENVNSTINSKAGIKTITKGVYITRFAAIELNNLKTNVFENNIGLIENTGDIPKEQQPGMEVITTEEPEEPEEPEQPVEPEQPENPINPEEPENPGQEEQPKDLKTVSGFAWLDSNTNGQKDNGETYLSGIKVLLYDISTEDFIVDENGNVVEKITDSNGKYEFDNVEKGSYIVLFEYDTEEYKLITQNSDIVAKTININGQEVQVGLSSKIKVQNNISNINIGLRENLKFDLELNKYISKIVVQTSKETKTYDYDEEVLGKVEIHRKQIQGANVILEYTIKVKNTGEIAGTARNVVDYIPNGLEFSSELNKGWYLLGDNLYTKSLENTIINPGEEIEEKLILTKTMTNNNVGLINNRAEIYQDYNKYGDNDIDSTPNNQAQNEDDFGTTDVIIQVATGGSTITYIMLVIINIVLIYVAIRIMIDNEIIKVKTKEERR